MSEHWAIMPWLNAPEMTWQAVEDLLAQSLLTRVLLVNQGASQADREAIDRRIDQRGDHRVLCWHYLPGLPSLSAVWNRALAFVWELGGVEALVCNNDSRLTPRTYEHLLTAMTRRGAMFVSAVGKNERDWLDDMWKTWCAIEPGRDDMGGPDFSCYLIARFGHEKYPFDEAFIPAYHEDLDLHRRYMLGGDGDKIFSVNLPYLHYASGTLKQYTPEERAKFNKGFAACKAYYTRKWGGGPNEETFFSPFDQGTESSTAGLPNPPTTPALQRYWQEKPHAPDVP